MPWFILTVHGLCLLPCSQSLHIVPVIQNFRHMISCSLLLLWFIDWPCCCSVVSSLFMRLNQALFLFSSCTALLSLDQKRVFLHQYKSLWMAGCRGFQANQATIAQLVKPPHSCLVIWVFQFISDNILLLENLGIFRVIMQVWSLIFSQLKDEHQVARLTYPLSFFLSKLRIFSWDSCWYLIFQEASLIHIKYALRRILLYSIDRQNWTTDCLVPLYVLLQVDCLFTLTPKSALKFSNNPLPFIMGIRWLGSTTF